MDPNSKPLFSGQIQYFRVFLRSAYYLCICPFKLVLNPQTGQEDVKRNGIQMAFCTLFSFLAIFHPTNRLIRIFSGNFRAKPSLYIDIVDSFVFLSGCCITFLNLWLLPNRWKSLVESIRESNRPETFPIRAKRVALLIILLFISSAVSTVVRDAPSLVQGDFGKLAKLSSDLFFFIPSSWTDSGRTEVGDYCLGIFFICTLLYFQLAFHYFLMTLLISAITLMEVTFTFIKRIEEEGTDAYDKVVESFEKLKMQSSRINSVNQMNLVNHVARSMTYYSTFVLRLINAPDIITPILALFHLARFLITLLLAAAANQMVRRMEEYIRKLNLVKKMDSCTSIMMLHDINTNSVGLKGLDYFTVTYPFIGTMMSMILTFCVINIQFGAM